MMQYNDSKKNKSDMGKQNNMKITMREIEDQKINRQGYKNHLDVDRIMLERQMTAHNFEEDDDLYIGEVTGEEFDPSDVYAKGMPLRSVHTVRRSQYDNNDHLDFNLFDKIDKKRSKQIIYNDTTSGDYAGLDEAMKTITRGTDPYETCVSDINSTACWMHGMMFRANKEDYIINGFGLFSGFGVLYLISRGNTELELKNYFGFQDKKHLNAGLLTIRERTNGFRDQITIDNYLINDRTLPNRTDIAKKLKSLIFSIIVNISHANQETARVNDIIKTVSGLDEIMSTNTLVKSESGICMVSVAKISPQWYYGIDGITTGNYRNKSTKFIRFIGKTFDYFEDAEKQLVEIPMHGDIFVIGMILTKRESDESTSLNSLSTSINFIKPTVLDEVVFPMIKKRYKIRYNKTLQNTGLNQVFSEHELNGLYPENGSLGDSVQYVDLSFGTKSAKKRSNNKGYRTTRKFIANRPFEFYLRNTENNCIMMIGRL
jgi:serine protease inhibitor